MNPRDVDFNEGWREASKLVNPRDAIEQAGGLYGLSDLADRWGITRQWARVLMRRDGMPAPVLTAGGRELWFGDEADAAFSAHSSRILTRKD